jgi:hypothetical protein
MHTEYDRWNDLIGWLYETPKESMSVHMKAARQVTLFHGEVCNGGLYDKLAYRDDEYPHAELVWSYERICGEPTAALIREGLGLLRRPSPVAELPEEANGAFSIAVDSVSRKHDLETALGVIGSVFPNCPRDLQVLAYEAAVANAHHFEPWDELDSRYFAVGDKIIFEQVLRYAESFSAEWSSSNH